jgi:hypothetical protein
MCSGGQRGTAESQERGGGNRGERQRTASDSPAEPAASMTSDALEQTPTYF